MHTSQNSASLGTNVHVRTPILILLPSDLKRLVQFFRTMVERHAHPTPASESQNASSEK
jgi:hypothetical protein